MLGLNMAKNASSNLKSVNPKMNPLIFIVIILVAVIGFSLFALSNSDSHKKNSRGVFNADLNMPENQPKEKFIVREDQGYISKSELDTTINRNLYDTIKNFFDEESVKSDKRTSDMIKTFSESRNSDLQELRNEMHNQNQKFEDALSDLKNQFSNPSALNQKSNTTQSGILTDYNTSNSNQNSNLNSNTSDNNPYSNNPYSSNPIQRDGLAGNSSVIVDNFTSRNDPVLINSNGKISPGFTVGEGINAGTTISGLLKTGCISSTEPCPVLIVTNEDIKYKNKIIIPKNTNLIGSGISDYGARKIFINVNRLVLGNREIEVKAHLVNDNGVAGFCSKYIDKAMQRFWPVFALNFSAGVLQAFKDVSYYTNGTSTPVKVYDDNMKNSAIDGVTNGVTQWSDILMRDAQAQGAIIIVNPKIKVQIFIDEKILLQKFKDKF